MSIIEPIKPNDKDVFTKEILSDNKFKISFRDSFIIIEPSNEGFKVTENKCKNLYDLKKIYGYISSL